MLEANNDTNDKVKKKEQVGKLRECLKGAALGRVPDGVKDILEAFNRLNEAFGNPSKVMAYNIKALEELQRLNKISQNNNPSEWEIENKEFIKICSLNCRSLKKHHEDIAKDDLLMKSDIICLNETWEESDYIRVQ